VRGVADVEQRLTGQLVEQASRDGQAADTGVEDPDRRVGAHGGPGYVAGGLHS